MHCVRFVVNLLQNICVFFATLPLPASKMCAILHQSNPLFEVHTVF